MNVCSFTDLREHLRERLDEVHESRTPLLVTRQGTAAAVVLDKEEYDGLMETLHLLSSPKNAERLLNAIADAEAGKFEFHDLIDPGGSPGSRAPGTTMFTGSSPTRQSETKSTNGFATRFETPSPASESQSLSDRIGRAGGHAA